METIVFRNPIDSDVELILNWRNAPEVSSFSTDSAEISERQHSTWFANRVARLENEPFWIVVEGDKPFGFVRFDLTDHFKYKISILVTSEYRGKGFGGRILKSSIERLLTERAVVAIEALVHSKNLVSIRMFEKEGFTEIERHDNFILFQLPLIDIKTLQT